MRSQGSRPGARAAGILGVLALACASLGSGAGAQRADALPVLHAQLFQSCGSCVEPGLITSVVTGLPDFMNQNVFLRHDFSVIPGSPFTIPVSGSVGTQTGLVLGGPFSARSDVLTDILTTVSFPTEGPVLDLPPGHTFNSVDGRVVDNHWLGGAVPPPVENPVEIPAGSAAALLAGGLALPRARASLRGAMHAATTTPPSSASA